MRKTIIIISCCVGLLLAGYAGYRGYKVWNEKHLMGMARGFLTKSDARNALLCVQQVLRSDPANVEATRTMANLTEAAHSPSALLWRARVVELAPHSLDDRLALAKVAMAAHDYAIATNTLAGVETADQHTVAYQNMAGAVAAAANQPAQAEEHFLEATQLDPHNPFPQLNLSVVRLRSTNAPVAAEARASLEILSENPTNSNIRRLALRELVFDALRRNQSDTALRLSSSLLKQTNAVFADRVMRLEVLHQSTNVEFKTALAEDQQQAGTDSGKILALATWEMANTPPTNTLDWLRSLPKKTQTNQPATLLIAECSTMAGDWSGLQSFLAPQNWSDVEFMRHAFLTRALRGESLDGAAKAEWEMALKSAANNKTRMTMLLRLAAGWHWQSEAENLLWSMVNQFPDDKGIAQALTQLLYANEETKSLMLLFRDEARRSPSNLEIKNDLAMTALLLNNADIKPYELAREVYQSAPTNAAYASTYAFSLYKQGKKSEALKVMKALTLKELENPSIAGYYGLILKASGDDARARTYLEITSKARVLPEERKLFNAAMAEL